MIDNLKDAITHAREVAKERNETANLTPTEYGDYINSCRECASEHEQLAAWLTELQKRREADRWSKWVITEIQCPNCLEFFDTICYSSEELKKCPSCGATMKGGAE